MVQDAVGGTVGQRPLKHGDRLAGAGEPRTLGDLGLAVVSTPQLAEARARGQAQILHRCFKLPHLFFQHVSDGKVAPRATEHLQRTFVRQAGCRAGAGGANAHKLPDVEDKLAQPAVGRRRLEIRRPDGPEASERLQEFVDIILVRARGAALGPR